MPAPKNLPPKRLRMLTLVCFMVVSTTLFYRQESIPPSSEPIDVPSVNASGLSLRSYSIVSMNDGKGKQSNLSSNILFYLIPTPELSTWLVGNYSEQASNWYAKALNEERAEIWLHRAFQSDKMSMFRTLDPAKADVFVIGGYFHLRKHLVSKAVRRRKHLQVQNNAWIDEFLENRIIDKQRPHLVLVPTWNPAVSRKIGINPFIMAMVQRGINVWSVGFERNPSWQNLPPERIIPIPYVVDPPWNSDQVMDERKKLFTKRNDNFIFYAGAARRNSIAWAGCNRARMLSPLHNVTANMDVRIVAKENRLTQAQYNERMATSEFCLILCGDTPSSRSLTSAMVYGCIPIRIGSRLRGLCELPCKAGFGFTVSGLKHPHLPFSNAIDWTAFPELDEAAFTENPYSTLQSFLSSFGPNEKKRIRSIMMDVQMGWIYGWGDPTNSTDFGEAASFIWESFVAAFQMN